MQSCSKSLLVGKNAKNLTIKTNLCNVENVLLLSLTYKRYSGSVCDEQSCLNVHPNCSLPSLLAHLKPAGKERQTDG